jgi:hypothetical protein
MEIRGSLPFNIAKAYGLGGTSGPAPARPPVDARPAPTVNQLIAGRTNQPVDFDAPAALPMNNVNPLQLYTRAADRIEAAVGIEVGKKLDVTG